MNSKIAALTNKIHPFVWQVICLLISILVFSLILVNRSPNLLRPLSMALRSGFGVAILLAALFMYAAFRVPGWLGGLLALTATMSLFALGLAGTWASGKTQSILLSGLIPISDATNYYIDALRILHGREISDFSGMRPLFPGFLSFLLWLSGRNLMAALGILTAIAGISSHLASRKIQETHGTGAAIFFLMLMFLYFRHHSGTTMSESFGLSASLLGVALIWQGITAKNELAALSGITMIALALNIRPGAMFVLPALLIWGGYAFRGDGRFSIRFFIAGAILILAAFQLNNLMIKTLAGPGSAAFSNFSWALYGLASGGNSWTHVFEAHPELSLLPDEEVTPAIYKLAIDLMLREPSLLIKGAFHYWRMFFSNTWYNAFSFVAGENYFVNEAARWGMYLSSGLGILPWLKNRKEPFASLALFAALGVLASVPFVPPTDAYRVRLYAATIPFFALLPMMGVSYLRDRIRFRFASARTHVPQGKLSTPIFSGAIAILMVIAPLLITTTGKAPVITETACAQDMELVVVRFDKGTSLNVLRENIIFTDWMPNFHISVFRRNAHDLADPHLIERMASITPPSTLFYALDLWGNQEALIVIKSSWLPEPGNLLYLCGHWEESPNLSNYKIFNAELSVNTPGIPE